MSKIVKLTQKDIQNLVEGIINEQGDWTTDDMNLGGPEEQPGFSDYEDQEDLEKDDEVQGEPVELQLAKDEDGNFYIFKKGEEGATDTLIGTVKKK
jgi:hypothetical protein